MSATPPTRTRLTFRDGGWVVLLAGVVCAALLAWALAGVFAGHRPIGGDDLASYRFDLTHLLVPESELVPTGHPRDFLRVLADAGSMRGEEVADFNARHKRYLVSGDRVAGVEIDGERRAYPLSVLQAHEAVEDTLAGVPILVTYSPLCDAVAVYDRRLGDETLSFGVSGIVRNANTIYFERRDDERATPPSLWQQIDGRAIAGPAAARGERLRPIGTVSLARWADWIAAHPETTVILRDEGRVRFYRNISYERMHERPEIGFPVAPLPAADSWEPKRRVVVVESADARIVVDADRIAGAGAEGLAIELPTGVVRLRPSGERGGYLLAMPPPEGVRVLPSFWFAAHALLGADDAERLPNP
jgi:hypothetical protein